jgi:hypothetical protein
MNTNENWTIIERKMLELRILTNANWRNQEYELAALGERVLRSAEVAKAHSACARSFIESLPLEDQSRMFPYSSELVDTRA